MEPMNTRHGLRARHQLRPPALQRCLMAAAAAVLLTTAGTVGATQYQWRDASGRMVFSDQPPPASVPPARVIKAPAPVAATAPSPAATGPAASSGPAASAGSPTALSPADQEFAFRKRMEERAEQEKKAAESAEQQQKLAKACADAQGDIRALESGQRISRINAAGEREFLSDAERAQRLGSARKSVSERC